MAIYYADELEHHGIQGMKWGVRRFQNPDGSLTPEGRERYYGKSASDKFAKQLLEKQAYYVGPDKYFQLRNSAQLKNVAAVTRSDYNAMKSLTERRKTIEKEFFERKDYDKWVTKAAQERWSKEKDILQKEGWTYEGLLNWYKKDDGDQGLYTTHSFDVWLAKSGEKKAKDYLKIVDAESKADRKYQKQCEKLIKEFLGEHADEAITYTNAIWKTETNVPIATRGYWLVRQIMNTWDSFENEFEPGRVSIEDLMRLVN